jgi:hypothetical protein
VAALCRGGDGGSDHLTTLGGQALGVHRLPWGSV